MRNRYFIPLLIAGLIPAACNRLQESPTRGKLSAYIAESHVSLLNQEAATFIDIYPETDIEILGASTREAIVHLLNDSVNLIITDRQLNAEEQRVVEEAKLDVQEMKIGIDALVLLVHKLNELQSINLQATEDILTGKIGRWEQLPESNLHGPLELVLTGRNSGAYELLKSYLFRIQDEVIPDVLFERQTQVLQYIAAHPQAIGFVSIACFREDTLKTLTQEENARVRSLAFTGVDARGEIKTYKLHQANVYQGLYPLHYPLYLYFNKDSRLAAGFSAFIASAPGQKILLNSGLVPATMPVRLVQIK